jgi:hypothetical protein
MQPSSKLESALAWAARGFNVFPLRPQTKEPFRGFKWPDRATTDAAQIREWFSGSGSDCNIGLACGDGVLAVDIDCKDGRDGFASLLVLDLPFEALTTLTTRTPSGGKHLFFRAPDVANGVNRLGPGLDIRSRGGYVVAAGSELPNGRYTIDNEASILDAPPLLLAALGAPKDRVAGAAIGTEDTPEQIEFAIHRLSVEVEAPARGSRNDALFRAACAVKDIGVSCDTARELILLHWNPRLAEPLNEAEIEKTVGSAYDNGLLPQGAASPAALTAGMDLSVFEPVAKAQATPTPSAPPTPLFSIYRDGDDWRTSVDWLFYDLLPARGTGFLAGAPRSGKTFVAIDLAVSIATGRPFFGAAPDKRGGVLYLASEDASGLRKRLAAARGDGPALPITIIDVGRIDAKERQRALAELLSREAEEMRRRFGAPPLLAFVDTMSASGLLGEENGAEDGSRAVSALKAIADLLGGLAIGVHHPPKAGKGLRGSGALEGNADTILEVTSEPEAHVRHLSLEKSREAVAPRLIGSFELRKVALGVDDKGRDMTTCIVAATVALPKSARPPAHASTFLTALEHALIGEGEIVDGVKAVRKDAVQDQFREIGPEDSGYRSRQFNACLAWAIAQGHVRRHEQFGRDYLSRAADLELPTLG